MALDKLGYSAAEIHEMFQEADEDMSGDISLHEFKKGMIKKLTAQTRRAEEARTAYALFEGNDGGVDTAKAAAGIERFALDGEDAGEWMACAGVSDGGVVMLEGFTRHVMPKSE
jgi:hypothetical protein